MQHDFALDNQPGASLRGDLNEALQALVGQSSGDTAPSVTYPFMWWMDTTNGLLKQRNAGNTAWVNIAKLTASGWSPYYQAGELIKQVAKLTGENDFDTVPTVNGTPLAVGGSAIWTSMPLGMPFPLYDHIAGVAIPPNDDPNFRYVKLSAGANGAGQYNYGVLEAESVSSGSPFPTATSLVNLPGSPFDGWTINLINTERRFIRAGSSGGLQNDAFQGHAHYGSTLTDTEDRGDYFDGSWFDRALKQETAGTINAGYGTPRVANETRPRNIGATYYVRIL